MAGFGLIIPRKVRGRPRTITATGHNSSPCSIPACPRRPGGDARSRPRGSSACGHRSRGGPVVMPFFQLDHEAHRLDALRAARCLVVLQPLRLAAELAQHVARGTALALSRPSARLALPALPPVR